MSGRSGLRRAVLSGGSEVDGARGFRSPAIPTFRRDTLAFPCCGVFARLQLAVARRHLSAHGVLTRYSRYSWGTHRHSWGTRRCPRPAGGSLFPPVAYLRAREARFPGQKLPVPAAFANSIVWDRFLSLCAILSSNPKFVANRQAEDRACPLGWPAAIALLKSGGFQHRPLRSKVSRNVCPRSPDGMPEQSAAATRDSLL
jgi:hypothetical protein